MHNDNPQSEASPSRHLRLYRHTTVPGTWFVTKSLWPKTPVLLDAGIPELIIKTLAFMVERRRIALAAFVVMPEHWHALFAVLGCSPPGGASHTQDRPATLPGTMHSIDTWVGKKTSKWLAERNTAWEDGYHDTRVRSTRQFRFMLDYIENNPVKRCLVKYAPEWSWSSADPAWQGILTRPWPWKFEQDD